MREIRTAGIVGAGVIGGGWAARFLARGLDVVAWDPAPDAEASLRERVRAAWPSVERLGIAPGADPERITMLDTAEALAARADFVQESAPERLDLKTALHAALDAAAPPDVIIASSTSGLLPSEFQARCAHPDRVLVGHPFNPVYLLPLVELVAGERTAGAAMDHAASFYTSLGMRPLRVRNEVEGFLSDRLQEALWRENLHLLAEGIADTAELDAAIVYGPGLRWAFMGVNETFALAGGDAGMRHFIEQFGPALALPWTKLEAPALTPALADALVAGTEAQLAGRSVRELERLRDECLVTILEALQALDRGAGRVLAEHRARLGEAGPG